jgi:hypothetical protein
MIKETLELWDYLKSTGGLDIQNYDFSIIEELQNELSLPIGADFEKQLKDENISIEDFIVSFFKIVEPFSEMMSDLLLMFENAGAKTSNENLFIEFDFDNTKSDLKFNLEHFKNWINIWKKVKNKYNANLWNYDLIWSLCGVLKNSNFRSQNPTLRKWLKIYNELMLWPDFTPNLPNCSNTDLNQLIQRAWNLWTTIVKESSQLTKDRRELHKEYLNNRKLYEQNENEYSWSPLLLAQIDHDNWSGRFAEKVFSTIEELNTLDTKIKEKYLSKLINNLEQLFRNIPTVEIEEDGIINDFKEFLNLPIWKKRHELYSAWISTCILEALKQNPYRIHTFNKCIVFSFSGTHLATFDNFTPRLHVWSELRSPLENPIGKGRKKAIQPDYSLITDPISNKIETSILVIECKQYLNASKKNFVDAVTDYAKGRPNSNIILVNYGRISESINSAVPEEIKNRTFLIGGMKPNSSKAITFFNNVVRNTIFSRFGFIGQPSKLNFAFPGTVNLKWEKEPSDLDLHLFIETDNNKWEHISYSEIGSASSFPWAELDSDKKSGYGPKLIKIEKWIGNKYHIAVNHYSGNSDLKSSNAIVILNVGKEQFEFKCPTEGNGKWWDIVNIDVEKKELVMINKIVDRIDEFHK